MNNDTVETFKAAFGAASKLVEDSKKQSPDKRTEADITHFLLAPLLTECLGWLPFENIKCEDADAGAFYDFLLVDESKGFRCIIEAKKHDAIEKYRQEEANKRLGNEEFCIVTDFYNWYFYHKDFKDGDKLIPFMEAHIEDISKYEFSKIFFALRHSSAKKTMGRLPSFLEAVQKVKDSGFSPQKGDKQASNTPLFGGGVSLAREFNEGLVQRFGKKEKKQFEDALISGLKGITIQAGTAITPGANAPFPLYFEICADGGVRLVNMSAVDSKGKKVAAEVLTEFSNDCVGNDYSTIGDLLHQFGKNFSTKHWKIDDQSLKALGM